MAAWAERRDARFPGQAGAWQDAPPVGRPAAGLTAWEYLMVPRPAADDAARVVAVLNALGREGWRFATCHAAPATAGAEVEIHFLMMRQVRQRADRPDEERS
ncbi:MAG TPA: hypothetical protein VEB20_05105 [Azospirillaceae bacterium]|nr:hypothetical protein [Azospirillaceae bacterium]